MLAWQAMALDDLSERRMILGIGAGWLEREHTMFGYALGTVKQRLDRLEEGLKVITQLLETINRSRSTENISFAGRHINAAPSTSDSDHGRWSWPKTNPATCGSLRRYMELSGGFSGSIYRTLGVIR